MALNNMFKRLQREIGIKRCIILDGNVGDVYLNEKGQLVDLKMYLRSLFKCMQYDTVVCWDKVDGTTDDISSLELVEEVELQGEDYFSIDEMKELLEQLFELDNPYHCPHGRPTIISMSKGDLEKKFKRIV